MTYIIHAILSTLASSMWGRAPDRYLSFFGVLFLFIFLFALPAFQLEVGTDYKNYLELAAGEKNINRYLQQGELLYYFLFNLVPKTGIPHLFFIITALINTSLLINILRKLKNHGYQISIIVLLFLIATGMYQNQMNVIRTYTAVFCFINAIIYKGERKTLALIAFSALGLISHQTFAALFLIILIPVKAFQILSKAPVASYFVFFAATILISTPYTIEIITKYILPSYSHYLSPKNLESATFTNILTRVYYIPIHLLFIFLLQQKKIFLSSFERYLVGFWIVASSSYLLLTVSSLIFFRVSHYFSFFSILPIYYLLKSKFTKEIIPFILMYLLIAFIFKVFIFPEGEYHYKTILGPICKVPWSYPQC